MGLLGLLSDAAKSQIKSALKTSQVGREVLDTLQDIKESNVPEKKVSTATPKQEVVTTPLEKENTEEYYDNMEGDYSMGKLNKTRFNKIQAAAYAGDPVAQYKYGYALAEAAFAAYGFEWDKKHNSHLHDYCKNGYDNLAKLTDLSNAKEESIKWLTASAKQGFGLAMKELYDRLEGNPWNQVLEAYYWLKRSVETIPWYDFYSDKDKLSEAEKLFKDWKEADCSNQKLYEEWKENDSEQQAKPSMGSTLAEFRYQTMMELEDEYDKLKEKYNKLADEYNELLHSAQQTEKDYNELADKYNELLHSSSSSSQASSSSRSSGDDIVEVEIKYKYKVRGIEMPRKKIVSMTQREYKSLLNGSMKSRIAYVNSNFIISTAMETVTDVSISLV